MNSWWLFRWIEVRRNGFPLSNIMKKLYTLRGIDRSGTDTRSPRYQTPSTAPPCLLRITPSSRLLERGQHGLSR